MASCSGSLSWCQAQLRRRAVCDWFEAWYFLLVHVPRQLPVWCIAKCCCITQKTAASTTNGRHVYHTEAKIEHNAHERAPVVLRPLPALRPPCDGSVVRSDLKVYRAHKIQSPIAMTDTNERIECPRCHVTHVAPPVPTGKRLSRIGHHPYAVTDTKTAIVDTGRGIRPMLSLKRANHQRTRLNKRLSMVMLQGLRP